MEPYTVALTSCGRFDLLERTLRSLLPRLDGPVAKVIIAEDSGDRGIYDVVRQFSGDGPVLKVLFNDPPLGQITSIDRLYSRIETEWIFHCEDDWEFFGDGFIGKSFALLKEFDWLSMVGLRDRSEFAPDYFDPDAVAASGVRYRIRSSGVWSGLSFNPGLRRMRDYRIVGPYLGLQYPSNERRVSDCYSELGFRVAYLAEPSVRHIGDGRHLHDSAKGSGFGARLSRSIRKRLAKLRLMLDPGSDPVLKARKRLERAGIGMQFPPPPAR